MRTFGTIMGGMLLLSVVACDRLQGGDKGTSSSEPAGDTAPKANPVGDSFLMGRKYGFACVYALLDEAAASSKAHGEAKVLGTVLGVTTPPAPTKDGAM